MARKQSTGRFQLALTETSVRDLCSPRIFDQADLWQRSGHVRTPTYVSDTIQAEVIGTWQRMDAVTLHAGTAKLQTQCTCRAASPCRHAVAVLLHWLRDPGAFHLLVPSIPPAGAEIRSGVERPGTDPETPHEEYAHLMATHTMPELREIARRRGYSGSAQRKADLLEGLVPLLTSTANLDTALGELSSDAHLVLALVDLIRVSGRLPTLPILLPVFRAYGGEVAGNATRLQAVEELIGRSLLFRSDAGYDPFSAMLIVPRIVTSRLPPVPQLVTTLRSRPNADVPVASLDATDHAPNRSSGALSLAELMQVIALEIRQGAVGRRRPQLRLSDVRPAPPGWRIESREPVPTTNRWTVVNNWRLAPLPGPLVAGDREHLATRTGQSIETILFAVQMMVHLGIIDTSAQARSRSLAGDSESVTGGSDPLSLRETVMQELFARPPEQRTAEILDVWLEQMDPAADLRLITGPDRPLELYVREGTRPGLGPTGSTARKLIARIIGHMTTPILAEHIPDRGDTKTSWYDLESLLDLIAHLHPEALTGGILTHSQVPWWFARSGKSAEPLDLSQTSDWRHVWRLLVTAILEGPLSWLGLVDLRYGHAEGAESEPARRQQTSESTTPPTGDVDHMTSAEPPLRRLEGFRPQPAAGLLLDREVHLPDTPLSDRPAAWSVDPEEQVPIITIPAGGADEQLLAALSAIAELADALNGGLRFRLSADRLQLAFDAGLDGDQLLTFLSRHCGTDGVPAHIRSILEGWWREYGTIRLYDELAFIELSDDVLLRELRAATSLGDRFLEQLSPRVVAIDPADVDAILADLTRAGYTPRLLADN